MVQDIQANVIEVNKQNNTVLVSTDNGEDWFEIHPPASINFARHGPATIRFNGANGICYIRSTAPKKPASTYNKPFNSYTQKNTFNQGGGGFTQAKSYTPKSYSKWGDVDWDKISAGKCKHAFLIEAFKMGHKLEDAEIEAERWAMASMRLLSEKEIVQKEISKISKITPAQPVKVSTTPTVPTEQEKLMEAQREELRNSGYSEEEINNML